MKVQKTFLNFFKSQQSGGIILLICTVASLIIANSPFGINYEKFWATEIFGHHLDHWVNDGLMVIFFFLIGLELKREVIVGELSSFRNALLPIVGAVGGMLIPALVYFFFNSGTPTESGFGIPMATDIAFAIGILSLLGKKVPLSLKVFLTALAVIDDLGAIMVIAVFYSSAIYWINLGIALAIFILLLVLNKMRIQFIWIYLTGGIFMWYFMLHSGIHATISGVLLALTIPFHKEDSLSKSYQLQHLLHIPVAFLVLPVFALANTAITISPGWENNFGEPYALGILGGLIIGKPLGIILLCFIAVILKISRLPTGMNWSNLTGVGLLAGIGFTMSIFITLLAFDDSEIINNAKFMIMCASFFAGIIGYIWLRISSK